MIKNNVNYFCKDGKLKAWGVVMVALGFLLYYFGWGWISYILMCLCIPAGAVLFIIGSSGRASDEDIDGLIEVKMRGLDPSLDTDKRYASRIPKGFEPIRLEGYELRDGLMFRKAKDGALRSSEFTGSVLYVLTDAIYLVKRTFSLISDEEPTEGVHELSFDSISRAEIFEETRSFAFKKNLFRAKVLRLRLVLESGEEISLPIHDDLRSESAVELINRAVEKGKKV